MTKVVRMAMLRRHPMRFIEQRKPAVIRYRRSRSSSDRTTEVCWESSGVHVLFCLTSRSLIIARVAAMQSCIATLERPVNSSNGPEAAIRSLWAESRLSPRVRTYKLFPTKQTFTSLRICLGIVPLPPSPVALLLPCPKLMTVI